MKVHTILGISSLLIVGIVIVSLNALAKSAINRDALRTKVLESYKYQNIVRIEKGFYRGCQVTLIERTDYFKFRGRIYCTNLPTVESIIDARNFKTYIMELGEE